MYIDLDKNGKLVSITIEHAKENSEIKYFSYYEISESSKDIVGQIA